VKPVRVLGIDPGIRGAFAVVELVPGSLNGKLITVKDFPLKELSKNKSKGSFKTRIDLRALSFLLEQYSAYVKIALIEEVGTVGTNADPFSSFTFGFATGSVHGILANIGVKIETIQPAVWKAGYGLSANKGESLRLAKKFFPEGEKFLSLKKHDGRAEAMLLAHFAAKNIRRV